MAYIPVHCYEPPTVQFNTWSSTGHQFQLSRNGWQTETSKSCAKFGVCAWNFFVSFSFRIIYFWLQWKCIYVHRLQITLSPGWLLLLEELINLSTGHMQPWNKVSAHVSGQLSAESYLDSCIGHFAQETLILQDLQSFRILNPGPEPVVASPSTSLFATLLELGKIGNSISSSESQP